MDFDRSQREGKDTVLTIILSYYWGVICMLSTKQSKERGFAYVNETFDMLSKFNGHLV